MLAEMERKRCSVDGILIMNPQYFQVIGSVDFKDMEVTDVF